MSMLSAQCDELRAMAESVGLAMPQAATLMMEAADTIWSLRCRCAALTDARAVPPEVVSDGETDGATGYCRCGMCGESIDPWDHFCRHCGTGVAR